MWRVGPLISTLLSLDLLMLVPAVAVPSAGAAPGADAAARIQWSSCERFLGRTSAPSTARCAAVPVPVDYADPGGSYAWLALIRIPAAGPRMGSLLVNPGGPGASAVDTVAAMGSELADTQLARHFDLVGFDPRGVGHSAPSLRCRTDAEFDAYRRDPMIDYSPTGVAHIEQVYRQLAQSCVDRIGAGFLEHAGTASAARDMDLVRQVLGEEQINYLGYSYGTELGTAYVERFSDRVRAMVLDGAIDPSIGPLEANINQTAGFQTAFNDYAADCARAVSCPLGTDSAQWVNRYHALVDPLVAGPGRTADPRGLSYADANTGTVNALYTPQRWQSLTSGLLGLQRGTEADDLLILADEYNGRDRRGHYSHDQDAFNAIRCVDAPSPTDSTVWADADRQLRQVAPFLSYGQFTGLAPRDLCALWPVPATSLPQPADPVAPGKVVVVSTTHDPATPYRAGVDLARQLGARLITYTGTQHTVVLDGDKCVDPAVTRFLVDSVLPPDGLRC